MDDGSGDGSGVGSRVGSEVGLGVGSVVGLGYCWGAGTTAGSGEGGGAAVGAGVPSHRASSVCSNETSSSFAAHSAESSITSSSTWATRDKRWSNVAATCALPKVAATQSNAKVAVRTFMFFCVCAAVRLGLDPACLCCCCWGVRRGEKMDRKESSKLRLAKIISNVHIYSKRILSMIRIA